MLKLVKANIIRLNSNFLYTIGAVLAFICTFFFVKEEPISQLARLGEDRSMMVVSFAIILFFSIFTGLFIGEEYSDGVIRNKVLAGHSQTAVYISDYLALLVGLLIMEAAWFLGGVAAGVSITGDLLVFTLISILYNAAYLGIMMAIAFRVKAMVAAAVTGLILFYALINGGLVLNFLVSNATGAALGILKVLYNTSAFGQLFLQVGFMDAEISLGSAAQILFSIVLLALTVFAGTFHLEKRDLK